MRLRARTADPEDMPARPSATAYGYLALGLAGIVAYALTAGGAVGAGLYSGVGLSGVLALLEGARRAVGRGRLPWLAFAGGVGLLVAGDTVYDARDLLGWSTGTPSAADWLYLAAYPLLAAGLVLLVRAAHRDRSRTTFVDAGIVTLAFVLALWHPFFADVGGDRGLAGVISAAYPTWDLLLLALATTFVFARSLGQRWAQLLVAAIVSLLVADFLWAILPDSYTAGDWMDRGWLLAYVLWGVAALHPSAAGAREDSRDDGAGLTRHRFVLLAAAMAVMPAAMAIDVLLTGRRLTAADGILGTALVGLLLYRLGATLWSLDATRLQLAARNELLLESEDRFRRVFADAPVAMAIVDERGRIVAGNGALAGLTEIPLPVLTGRSYADFVHPEERDVSVGLFAKALAAGSSLPTERRFVRPDGEPLWGLISLSRLPDGAAIVHIQDITDRKRYEAALSDQNRRLAEADREKDELISVVSHDLRTPLTSIVGYLELALEDDGEDGPLGKARREFLLVAQRNSQRLSRLVEDLLFVTRARAGRAGLELEAVDTGALVRDVAAAALPAARSAGVALTAHGDGTEIVADGHRLAEAVENLVSNAIKFTPAGGRVDVEVTADDEAAVVVVRDTGPGISAEDRERVFDRFFRAEGTEGVPGAGLGLAIVKAIAEAHGGTVSLESAPGEGAAFALRLPRHSPAAAAPGLEPEPVLAAAARG